MSNWEPIETAPTDDNEFYVGKWDGEWLYVERNGEVAGHLIQPDKGKWVFALTHNENPFGPYESRGWNHRNGPMPDAKYWMPVPDALARGPE